MTMNELTEAIASLDETASVDLARMLVSGAVGNRHVQSEIDRYNQRSINGVRQRLEKEISDLADSTESGVHERLDRLESALAQKQRDLELSYHAKRRCLEAGVDEALLDGFTLTDEVSIDKKVLSIAKALEAKETEYRLAAVNSGYKPRFGGTESPSPRAERLSLDELGKMPTPALEGLNS